VFLDKAGYSGEENADVGKLARIGRATVLLKGPGCAAVDRQGRIVWCAGQDLAIKRLEKDGTRTVLADGFEGRHFNGPNDVAIAADGTIWFTDSDVGLRGGIRGPLAQMPDSVWRLKDGKVTLAVSREQLGAEPNGIALSPDDAHVAAHRHEGQGGDIWITDMTRGATSRLTFDASLDNQSPIWSPDGRLIAFASIRNGKFGLYQKAANNGGVEERLYESDTPGLRAVHWAPDGKTIVFQTLDPKTRQDLWFLPLSGREAVPFLRTPFNENHGQISPDGRWITYVSNETGLSEVYVQPYPSGAGKWQVSVSYGNFPQWRRDGRELYFINGTGRLMAADIKSGGSSFEVGVARELFDSGVPVATGGGGTHPFFPYAAAADGQRFLVTRPLNDTDAPAQLAVIVNWASRLKK